jgi:hypothetical protein
MMSLDQTEQIFAENLNEHVYVNTIWAYMIEEEGC